MSEAPPASPPIGSTPAQPATPTTTVTNKIFVSGLGEGDSKEEIRQLFSCYGEVLEVMVDGTCATVTFQEERVVQEMEQMREIMLRCRKLNIARVLEEHLDSTNNDAPFYQGVKSVPEPNQYVDTMLSSSYPSYKPAAYPYPVWYPQPSPSQYYDPAISDCGPVQTQQLYQPSGPGSHPALPSTSNVNKQSAVEKSVFSFDTMATQLDHQNYPSYTPTNAGCCQVCSTPAVQGVAPLAVHQLPGHPPYYGHQLQPLTPMTPSLHNGYLLPPTPTPTNLPPMTPTYYLPPSPAPTYMMYQAAHPRGADATSLPYTSLPPPQAYTNLKPTDNSTHQEDVNTHRQNVTYFTSPFKRFTKFRGTPTPARFPLRAAAVPQGYRGRGGEGNRDSSSWYQQGDRWGHRSGGEGDQGYQQGDRWGHRSGWEEDQGYQQGDQGYQQGDRWGHRSGGEEDQGYQQGDRWGHKSGVEGDIGAPDILRDCNRIQVTKKSSAL